MLKRRPGTVSAGDAPSRGSPSALLDDETAAGPSDDSPEDPSSASDDSDFRHERFRIGEKLGEGGMGVVYRAWDAREGRYVALKLVKGSLAGPARRRFEREFRSLASLRHPHCLSVYDYGELGTRPFFTMELFLGLPITSVSGGPLAERLDPLLQLTQALDYVHIHGIVHRDVKPSNILVRPTSRDDGTHAIETRLMDFGLAKYRGVKSSLSVEAGFVGTVAYCAPEQINLDELDHRADLYCMGLVAYEVLGGRYAFAEARLAGLRPLMRAQLNDKPKPLSEVNPEIPSAISDVVMKYLRKQPRRRPESADLLRSAIAGYLGVEARSIASGISLPSSRPMLSVTGFVCRASEQEILADVVRRCLQPGSDRELPASVIVVGGEPGIGKSSVTQEAVRIARGHGCLVYEGRCFDGNLSPFQPFVEILRRLVVELKLQERREHAAGDEDLTGTHVAGHSAESLVRLLGILDDYRGELLRVAPELRKYLPGEAYRQVDYGREADYIYRALAAFFLEIATFQPLCLNFEDLQWADKSSLDLLRHLAAALETARSTTDEPAGMPKLVIVASARTGYSSLEGLLSQLRERRHVKEIHLSALTESETRELISLRLNCRSDELASDLVARVHSLCGGNPFFISETVREWHEKEAITRDEHGWVLKTEAADSTDLPETVRDVMRLRIQGLPPVPQQVLNAAAVIGAVVELDLLTEALPDLSESDILDAIDVLIPRRVFRETGNAGRVEFVHDLLRELPYQDLSGPRRASLHRRIGELLEQRRAKGQAVSAAILADHFRVAEEVSKQFRYAIEAAEQALEAYAFESAAMQIKQALNLGPAASDSATRSRLWNMLGVAHGAAGDLDLAISDFRESLKHVTDEISRAGAELGIGEALHRKGETAEATSRLDRTLRELGYPRPTSTFGLMMDMWRAALRFHLLPARRSPDARDEERNRLACLTYTRILQVTGMSSLLQYTHGAYRFASFAMRTGDTELHHYAYSKFSLNTGMFSLGGLSGHYVRLAGIALRECRGLRLVPIARAHVGCAHYFAGRLAEAEKELAAAAGPLDKSGEWFAVFTHHVLRHIHGIRSDLASELREAEWEIAQGAASGDAETLAWGRYGKAHVLARMGRFEESVALAEIAVSSQIERGSRNTIGIGWSMVAYARLQASDYSGARRAAEEARAAAFRACCVFEFVGIAFPLLVESLLGPNWHRPGDGVDRATARKAWSESRFARFIGGRYPNYRPHALRVSGRAAFALGKTGRAANFFERSIGAAEKLGARYDLARAYLDASLAIPDKATEYRGRARSVLDQIGAVVPEAERPDHP